MYRKHSDRLLRTVSSYRHFTFTFVDFPSAVAFGRPCRCYWSIAENGFASVFRVLTSPDPIHLNSTGSENVQNFTTEQKLTVFQSS
jgi:hypothetical protein